MALRQTSHVMQHLRRAALLQGGAGLTDGELLGAFLARNDGAAFEALVRRHGPMVLGVCRRLLNDPHDAEDAFQATFLVLVRKAASVVPREQVGNWLYGVAYRTAREARRRTARRRARERQVPDMPHPPVEPEEAWSELRPLLDREIRLLPDKYRLPVVLCDLEGRTRREVARQLRVPEGTLSNRLAAARRMLARRLARHGLGLSGGALAGVLGEKAAAAAVPPALLASTLKAATLVAAGRAAAGAASGKVFALTEGVLRAMYLNKLKALIVLLVAAAVLGLGAGGLLYRTRAAEPAAGNEGAPRVWRAQPGQAETGKRPRRKNLTERQALEYLLKEALTQGEWEQVHEKAIHGHQFWTKALNCQSCHGAAQWDRLTKLQDWLDGLTASERKHVLRAAAVRLAVRDFENVLKRLREVAPDRETEREALAEIERAVQALRAKPEPANPDPPRAAEPRGRSELTRARAAAARGAYAAMKEQYRAGKTGAEPIYQWSLRALKSQEELGSSRADRMEALREHLDRMKELEALARRRLPAGDAGRLAAEFYRVEAELWLARGKKE